MNTDNEHISNNRSAKDKRGKRGALNQQRQT